jgi:uncharacterized protein (UPF0333 family)
MIKSGHRCAYTNKKRNHDKRRAQVSVEYLIVLGIAFTVLIPAGYFFYTYSQNSNEETVRSQIDQLGREMLVNAESIYGLADGSLITLELKYPDNMREIYILNQNELVIRYELSSGMNDAVFFSKIPLSGTYDYPNKTACTPPCINSTFYVDEPKQGNHNIRLESKTNYVLMTLIY